MEGSLGIIILILLCCIVAFVVIVGIAGIVIYNSIVKAKTRVNETLQQIDVRLQNRYDLLPDLIQAVEKATTTDKEIQTRIAEVRSAADEAKSTKVSADNAEKAAATEDRLTSAIQGLRISVEAYPELRSQEAIQNFMNQDQSIEEKIAAARQIYNSTVREYNEKIAVFPNSILAGMFKFQPATYFEAKDEAKADISPDWGGKTVTR
ncbi:MAG: LemA family protein [Candidatus Dojkabacteria bacterium]